MTVQSMKKILTPNYLWSLGLIKRIIRVIVVEGRSVSAGYFYLLLTASLTGDFAAPLKPENRNLLVIERQELPRMTDLQLQEVTTSTTFFLT